MPERNFIRNEDGSYQRGEDGCRHFTVEHDHSETVYRETGGDGNPIGGSEAIGTMSDKK